MQFDALQTRRLYRENPLAVELGLLSAVIVVTTLWQSVVVRAYAPVSNAVPAWLDSPLVLGPLLASVFGTAVVALVYVRVRGVPVSFRIPVHEHLPVVALAAVLPVLLVGQALVVGDLVGVTARSMTKSSWGTPVGLETLVRRIVVPAVLSAFGLSLLIFGAVQGTLRDLTDPEHAVALTTLVAVLFRLFGRPPVRDVPTLVVSLFAAAALVAVGYSAGLVYAGATRGTLREVVAANAPALAVGTLGALALLGDVGGLSSAAYLCLWVGVFGLAAHVAERTRSVWVPMVAVAAFEIAVGVAVYAESVSSVVGVA